MLILIMIFQLSLVFLIISILSFLFYMINKNEKWDNYTSMSFECGFGSFKFSRFSFSFHYFLIAIIFLFLDLEFCFLLPYFFSLQITLKSYFYIIILTYFILVGLILECQQQALNWMI